MTEFDPIISRIGTDSVKWDSIIDTYHEQDLLPLWVADMDFLAPEAVRERFKTYINHGIFGYAIESDDLYRAVIEWEKDQHHVSLNKEEIIFSSGVLPSLTNAVQTFTAPGDALLIFDPVYPPFAAIISANGRRVVRNPLIEENDHFAIDLSLLEQQLIKEQVKAVILCNPHNPGGRVWTKQEIQAVAALCKKHDCFLFSDEIHQDLIFFGHTFTSVLQLEASEIEKAIVFTSATKTFNLAGIKNSMVFIKNPELREQFIAHLAMNHQQEVNTFGLIGTQAAYEGGKEWLEALVPYIEENIEFTLSFFKKELPNLRVLKPQGTYLMWVDFSNYISDDTQLMEQLVHKGKVVLNPGIDFGPSGHGHMRLNVACPRKTLEEGLDRIRFALLGTK